MKNKLFLSLLALSALLVPACSKQETSSESKPSTNTSSKAIEKVKITFDLNYDGSQNSTLEVEKGKNVTKPDDPTRTGFTFQGWFTDKDATIEYDFASAVTSDMTLYAGWLDSSKTYFTVTFDLNYEGSKNMTMKVEKDDYLILPEAPVRDGYEFVNWFNDKACTDKFKVITPITADTTLYAGWISQFVFEAEYIPSIVDMSGAGYSGTATGLEMIKSDDGKAKASNNHYVTYLYANTITLTYDIESDQDVSDAKLILRLSAEVMDISFTYSEYNVKVNGSLIAYPEISITNVPKQGSGEIKEFQDFTITKNLNLKKGSNKIELVTNNNKAMFGTMTATAPMVDCMKITTDASLSWEPKLDNID